MATLRYCKACKHTFTSPFSSHVSCLSWRWTIFQIQLLNPHWVQVYHREWFLFWLNTSWFCFIIGWLIFSCVSSSANLMNKKIVHSHQLYHRKFTWSSLSYWRCLIYLTTRSSAQYNKPYFEPVNKSVSSSPFDLPCNMFQIKVSSHLRLPLNCSTMSPTLSPTLSPTNSPEASSDD